MIPTPPPGLVAVAKNGKFFGYADPDQVRKNGLELYDPTKAPKEELKEETKEPTKDSGAQGADPAQVKKAPPPKASK